MSINTQDIKKNRPISPHLSIYKPQISSILSIGHRLSGFGLFISLSIFCWWFIFWSFSGFKSCYLNLFDYKIVKIFLFLASYGFFYHLCTGLRHLIWDTGRGFSISAINFSGWLIVVSSIILTIIFWLCI